MHDDDLRRSRVTVLFRAALALVHGAWLLVLLPVVLVVVVPGWFATLATGRLPLPMHRFLSRYVRHGTHVVAFAFLAAGRFPSFTGRPGYPVDLEIDPPAEQRRIVTLLRAPLLLPPLLLSLALGGGPLSLALMFVLVGFIGAAPMAAFLAWWSCLVRGRMPAGLRDLIAYAIGYAGQAYAYAFLLTDRYPSARAGLLVTPAGLPDHPVRIRVDDDLLRPRVLVLFRGLLIAPHQVWLQLWFVLAVLAAAVSWLVTLVTGRTPQRLHRFLAAFVRYQAHVTSFAYLVGRLFPGFTGAADRYPVTVEIDGPAPQSRLVTLFRLPLAIPALLLTSALSTIFLVLYPLAWVTALITGRMRPGLQDLGAAIIRYQAQLLAYVLLLTDRYPHASPLLASTSPEPPHELLQDSIGAAA